MQRRQTMPRQWLIVNAAPDGALWPAIRRLPRRSGVLVIARLDRGDLRDLRRLARRRDLTVWFEGPRTAARVHGQRELTLALMRRPQLVLISPLYATRTHPDWPPLPRMTAASLARLAAGKAVALGGMDARRFRTIEPLGFQAWAGISAFRT